ncbi:HAD family hydrolase [Leptolyngbya iicbica LK]|uniref:HAD family hydrolase n=3 Tax=Cyanophyceae TaxID=3028117 RepID=A0A4Q7E510_9CYAN|nr:HAD family hydrolase [Leptolyngbya sp. LK]
MHLLFDLDGTLTNPYQGITACILDALQQLGQPLPDERTLTEWIGPPLQDSFVAVLGDEALASEAVRLYRDRFATVGLYENEVYEGIAAMLSEVARSPHMAWVCTSKPRVFAEKIVAHFQLAPFFHGVYGSELNGDRAHKADLIAHLLTTEGIAAKDAVMIGDRHHDINGAKHNGLRAIGVTWGFGTAHELTQAGADGLCHAPGELMGQFQKLASLKFPGSR